MRASWRIDSGQVEIQDILALVVGYAMTALLFRAFWPAHPVWLSIGVPGSGLYLWLGLAMSGPIIILRRRLSRTLGALSDSVSESDGEVSSRRPRPTARAPETTWAERAWLLIGIYWIVLSILIIPARLHDFNLGDVVLFGLAPVVAAIGLRLLGRHVSKGPDIVRGWTHSAAVVLLVTWPLAWICLIVLGWSMR